MIMEDHEHFNDSIITGLGKSRLSITLLILE